MMCKLYKFLYLIIPIKKFQSFLIKEHFSVCSRCQKEFEIDDVIKKIAAFLDNVKKEEALWPLVKQNIYSREEKRVESKKRFIFPFSRNWRLVLASLIFIAVMGIILVVYQHPFKKVKTGEPYLAKESPRVIIKYAKIKGKDAISHVYQTSSAAFILFTEIKKSGE